MKYRLLFIVLHLMLTSYSVHTQETLHRGNGSEPDSLAIHQAQGLNAHNILRDLYEGLMTLDERGQSIYGAAVSHTVKGNVWTFKLKKEGRWSDGTPVIAADFVRAWRHAIDPKTAAPYGFLLENIIHATKISHLKMKPKELVVRALDNWTLEIRLFQSDSGFLEKLSLPVFYPQPLKKAKGHGIISNGAYKMANWTVQEKITLEKNPYYYNIESVYFDRVIYWVIEDQSSELKRFRAGELDITESIPDSQINWIKQNLNSQLHIAPYLGTFFLGLNSSDKNLKNKHLRQALSLAIDRGILAQKVLKTGQQPAHHFIPRSLVGKDTEEPVELNKNERIAQARESMRLSGINPKKLTLELLYNNSENQRKVALAVASMWRQVLGIRAQLLNQEWKVFVQSRRSDNRQVFRSGWIADYADALSFLELFTSKSRFNFYHYNNPEYDQIIRLISRSKDVQKKNQLIEQAEKVLLHDIPAIPLYYYVSRHLVNNEIRGYTDNVADRHLSKYLYRKGE